MRLSLVAALALMPAAALAVGSEDDAAPEPSETVTECEDGLVFDTETETCLPPEESTNDEEAMLEDIRSLAYEGRYAAALDLLDTLDRNDPLVRTYLGFVARKTGDVEAGMAHYAAALGADPDLHIARSYRGMAYLEAGDTVGAWGELQEIRARGGAGTRAEAALIQAIETGITLGY